MKLCAFQVTYKDLVGKNGFDGGYYDTFYISSNIQKVWFEP